MLHLLTRDTVVNEKLEQWGESRGAGSMWRQEMSFQCVWAGFMICEWTRTEENRSAGEEKHGGKKVIEVICDQYTYIYIFLMLTLHDIYIWALKNRAKGVYCTHWAGRAHCALSPWLDPRLHLSMCRSLPEQDVDPCVAPKRHGSAPAIGVWMWEWVNERPCFVNRFAR